MNGGEGINQDVHFEPSFRFEMSIPWSALDYKVAFSIDGVPIVLESGCRIDQAPGVD